MTYEVGDKIRLVQHDAESPTVRFGEITSINLGANEVSVTIDSWAGLGGNTYNMIFDDEATWTAAQRTRGYMALASSSFSLSTTIARLMGP